MAIPAPIQTFIDAQADAAPARYDDLRAVVFNGTLKRSPEPSQTDGLLAIARGIIERVGVRGRRGPHGRPRDPAGRLARHDRARLRRATTSRRSTATSSSPADIIIIAGPIWLGDQSSQTRKIIERLYAYSGEVNAAGQWSYYGKVGGAVTTGNEDGGKHVSAQVLYALQHIGLTVPPQSDAYWNGEAGPGPVLPRPRGGRRAQRVDDPQHGLHDLEPPAPRADAQGRRRRSRPTATRRTTGTSRTPTTRTPSTASPAESHSSKTGAASRRRLDRMNGAISFFELGVGDAAAGRVFYEGLFGWGFQTGPSGNGWVIAAPGTPGGMHPNDAGGGPYLFFAVDDMDAAIARVVELGGEILPDDGQRGDRGVQAAVRPLQVLQGRSGLVVRAPPAAGVMARVVRHESERDVWAMIHGAPDPRLGGYVLGLLRLRRADREFRPPPRAPVGPSGADREFRRPDSRLVSM